MEQSPEYLIPEGDLPPGHHPSPGFRPGRDIWSGGPPPDPEEETTRPRGTRLIGVDAARGFALLGMIAVHTYPAYNTTTNDPSLVWFLFSGKSSALFALLAGISVAMMSGWQTPLNGRRLAASRVSLAVRALLILILGLGINQLEPLVFNILPYYGLYFLLVIPFLRLGPIRLFLAAAVTAVIGPLLIHLINSRVDFTAVLLPSFSDLIMQPGATFLTLLAGGTFPALSWMAYLFLGMGLGRLDLGSLINQIRLLASGLGLAFLGASTSSALFNNAGGWRNLLTAPAGWNKDEIIEIDRFGPPDDQPLPTDSLWWLAVDGPHTNTPLSLLVSAGFALAALGGFLLLARAWEQILVPLVFMGSMTLTLYSTHLVFITYATTEPFSTFWYLLQIVASVVFAIVWSKTFGRGPLERLVTDISKKTSALLIGPPSRSRHRRKG
ncbi:heparan-alpha-glucosaminide N-acetyltransferase domain-containing protein [Corynebacterium alimapuense]|uniref:Heparan-alpha-glucosaminide N-acetyltransferase catalytic domain-containing protein n=1 Tax=Corynebacterium alimapuense TaxID=1576874 RepID=A0A3M8K8I6_9CORY|nr:heparan-alpha-glucosaminide N-acetyltransferase domain-containing protein [Corynebacterium alimapuense]RNE49543.1 hypothetical protein C5L39_04115 [Corynebacterium alimapuense]